MGGGDDAAADVDRSLGANTHDFPVLKDAEQPHLCRERQLADLVEKQRAAISLFEPALPARDRAGERPRFVAKQLRVDQFRCNRAAVDATERSAPEG
jgi:hypothetical protein